MKKSISIILAILMCFSCFSMISFAEEAENEHITTVPDGYVGIYTIEDLKKVRSNLEGKYILMNNLEFTEEDFSENGNFYNSGYGWTPIGTYHKPFRGIFDGNNYVIKNLKINDTRIKSGITGFGFFGSISNATVNNLYLLDVDIVVYSRDTTSIPYTGGICGYVNVSSEISYCVVSGSITSSYGAGGICQFILNNSRISNCINLATVTATEYTSNTGKKTAIATGICKQTSGNVIIDKCINIGTIISSKNASGIVSTGEGATVSNCFNIGEFVASYSSGIGNCSNIKNCYSISQSASNSICTDTTTSIINCYYLENIDSNFSVITGTGKTSEEMSQQETFKNWDFDTVWTMGGRTDYPYPELKDVPLIFPDETIPHEHNYTSEVTTPSTHLTEGLMTFTCACGDTYTEAIAKTTEHTYNAVVTAPTCTEKGYTTYTCECGDSYIADYIDATGHSHTATVTTPATHISEGLLTYTCHCGDTYTNAIAKTSEHTFSEEIIKEPTCTAKGQKLFTCECGYSYTDAIAKAKHSDNNNDSFCDNCGTNTCSHMCHQSGFNGFIWKIVKFFWKLFGMNPVCDCGAYHY